MISVAPLALVAVLLAQPVHDQIGVNIHFTGAPQRDLDLLEQSGFGWVRMDFAWQSVERKRGHYRFDDYDQLVDGLARRGMRALLILDYSNPLYETGRSVRTAEGRAAFARFAAAAAAHFRGRGVRWEIWNEPNLDQFWSPQPADRDYLALAKQVVPAIHAADPETKVLGPATSRFPWKFLEYLFAGGLLDQVDQVSVHPYRGGPPETATADYQRLRALIGKYTSAGATPRPIVSGEWGYSNWHQRRTLAREQQAAYLARQLLNNIAEGVSLSIWYDWCNDGPDPKNTEHNFGTVTADRHPKPAFLAVRTLSHMIGKLTFQRRFPTAAGDHLLLFGNPSGGRRVLVAWTQQAAHPLRLKTAGIGRTIRAIRLTGTETQISLDDHTLVVSLTQAPLYVALPKGAVVNNPGAAR